MTTGAAPDVLAAIVAATRRRLEVQGLGQSAAAIRAAAERRDPDGDRFVAQIARASSVNVIAECKRRSPSRGVLRADYDAPAIAAGYEAHGAAAVSVLTEPTFFDGSLDDLRAVRARVRVPLLRKDFVIDERQLFEARAAGADAVLLIVAALEPGAFRRLHARAGELGLAALVEVHDRGELAVALSASPRVIGVNNRNLRTLAVDPLASLDLIGAIPDEVVAVAESGLRHGDDLRRLRDAGYDAFLVGERLVADADPGRALGELLSCS
jgi:indole-3-glycerol phosphate synthase